MPELYKLQTSDHNKTRNLYETIFSEDPVSFVDYYYHEKTRNNQILVVTEDGAIRSMLHLNPYRMYVNGKIHPTYYTVAVATEEKYRHRKYATNLIHEALRLQYQEGCPFSFLMPANEKIYTPHGYRTVYEQNQSEMVRSSWYRAAEATDLSLFAVKENQRLRDQFQVFAWRDEAYYTRWKKEVAAAGGWPGSIPTEGFPKIMIRIADAVRMLESIRFRCKTQIQFHLTDPIIHENTGIYLLTAQEENGFCIVEKQNFGIPMKENITNLSIDQLGEVLFGKRTVKVIFDDLIPLTQLSINEEV